MKSAPAPSVHLCVLQPAGYVHSMGLLDAALYFRHQFEQLGAQVTVAKNRLRIDAPNLVFGAHLGFEPALLRTFCCLFVNLEQLGSGGSRLPAAYLELLRSSHVIDYDSANLPAYGRREADVPCVSFGFAPYLAAAPELPLEQRQFDLLFFGSMNPRRQRLIERIEQAGRTVVVFDAPVYGPERDAFIRQSRAVLNCHHYDSAVFEQVRAFQVLSLGTPLVSERTDRTRPGPAFETAVNWFREDGLERFFADEYPHPGFVLRTQQQLQAFRAVDPREEYGRVLDFARAAYGAARSLGPAPSDPQRLLRIGPGRDYRAGWLNIDIEQSAQPDLCLDLGKELAWPATFSSPYWGAVELRAGASELIHADGILDQVADLPALMRNCLDLLRIGGLLVIDVPYQDGPAARQDPTRVRAMDEQSWRHFTDLFWVLGWFEHRFQIRELRWLDAKRAVCEKAGAASMTVTLEKIPTTLAERMKARTMRPDFGGLLDAARPRLASTRQAAANAEGGPRPGLLAAIPAGARRVLELGCVDGKLARCYKEHNPGCQWWGFATKPQSASPCAATLDHAGSLDPDRDDLDALGDGFDVIVIDGLLERLRDPGRLLDALYARAAPDAKIICRLPNMGHASVIERLIAGDIVYDDAGLLDHAHTHGYSQASAFKALLDCGWLPSVHDQCRLEPADNRVTAALLDAAVALGIPRETAQRNLGLYQMILVCQKWQARADAGRMPATPFSVIVAVNRPWQFELNLARSPGLREVHAQIIAVENASTAAAAFAQGAAQARHPWRVFAHQDVYFPVGSGYAIAQQLAALEQKGERNVPVGVAGLRPGAGPQGVEFAGLVVDRIRLFDHGPSENAVSIDELAVALHRDTRLAIDPSLGWHLWATDLCLQAQRLAGHPAGRILNVPLFHNSASTWSLPQAFHASAETLLAKYPDRDRISTLCATLQRPALGIAAAA